MRSMSRHTLSSIMSVEDRFFFIYDKTGCAIAHPVLYLCVITISFICCEPQKYLQEALRHLQDWRV